MYPRNDLRSCARHIAAQCEKQSSLPASRRTLAKRPRRSVRNIGPSTSLANRENRPIHAPDTIICCACGRSSGHATTRISSLRASARRRPFPDEVAHCAFRMTFSGTPHAETLAVHVRGQVEVSGKSTQRVTRRWSAHRPPFREERDSRLARRAVTFVRTRWGVSDRRPSGPGTASGGWQRGSLTPHITIVSNPPGFGGGEDRRLDRRHGVSNYLFFNDLSRHVASGAVRGPLRHRGVVRGGEGEHCSRVCVPPLRHTVEQNCRR
jgi:hypothetical protein